MLPDLPLARRDQIAARLAAGQPVVAGELALEFGVSEDAVRRDLRALAAEGRCRRVYGGALPLAPAERPLHARLDVARARKSALAAAAAGTVQPGELLFLDSGSSNHALVEALPDDAGLTVATHAVDIAAAVLRRPGLRLLLVGGVVDGVIGGALDADAVQAVQRLAVDRCFLGACAVSAGGGIGALHAADAGFKRVLLAASRHATVLALNDKLGAHAPHRVAPLAALAELVVEHDADAAALAPLQAAGLVLRRAAPPPHPQETP